jgi:hypothetical protein
MEPHVVGTSQPHARDREPPFEAVDLDRSRRPGVPMQRPPQPWPNSRFPPKRMTAPPAAPRHGRPGRQTPPVYGTAVPLRGLSGVIRRAAYRHPDHEVRHWLLLLLGDRVDSWETRARRVLPVALPLAALGFVASRVLDGRR